MDEYPGRARFSEFQHSWDPRSPEVVTLGLAGALGEQARRRDSSELEETREHHQRVRNEVQDRHTQEDGAAQQPELPQSPRVCSESSSGPHHPASGSGCKRAFLPILLVACFIFKTLTFHVRAVLDLKNYYLDSTKFSCTPASVSPTLTP